MPVKRRGPIAPNRTCHCMAYLESNTTTRQQVVMACIIKASLSKAIRFSEPLEPSLDRIVHPCRTNVTLRATSTSDQDASDHGPAICGKVIICRYLKGEKTEQGADACGLSLGQRKYSVSTHGSKVLIRLPRSGPG